MRAPALARGWARASRACVDPCRATPRSSSLFLNYGLVAPRRVVVACSPAALSALASLPRLRVKKEAVAPAAAAPSTSAPMALSPAAPAAWSVEAFNAMADFAAF